MNVNWQDKDIVLLYASPYQYAPTVEPSECTFNSLIIHNHQQTEQTEAICSITHPGNHFCPFFSQEKAEAPPTGFVDLGLPPSLEDPLIFDMSVEMVLFGCGCCCVSTPTVDTEDTLVTRRRPSSKKRDWLVGVDAEAGPCDVDGVRDEVRIGFSSLIPVSRR